MIRNIEVSKLIQPVIKAFTIFADEDCWSGEDDNFWVMVQADIGPEDSEGSETYTFYVASPKRLEDIVRNDIRVGRGLLITNKYRKDDVERTIQRLVEKCKRSTWNDVVNALSRYSYTEYEHEI